MLLYIFSSNKINITVCHGNSGAVGDGLDVDQHRDNHRVAIARHASKIQLKDNSLFVHKQVTAKQTKVGPNSDEYS